MAEGSAFAVKIPAQLRQAPFQLVLHRPVDAGTKNIPENLLPLLGIRQQQPEEIPLGNHGNLAELLLADPQDLLDLFCNPAPLGLHLSVGEGKLRPGKLPGGALSPGLFPGVLRIPADRIGLSPVGEGEDHLRGGVQVGVIGPEHGGVPGGAAGLAVEGKGDGVKDCRFSCPGVPRNEVEPPLPQGIHVDLLPRSIGAEGGHRQSNRSHLAPSRIFSSSASQKAACSSPMGCPFWASYRAANQSSSLLWEVGSWARETPALRVRRLS